MRAWIVRWWPLAWAATVRDLDASLDAACDTIIQGHQLLDDMTADRDIWKEEAERAQTRASWLQNELEHQNKE